MNLSNIQVCANEACFNTDPNIKFQAEASFRKFMEGLNVSQYGQILENFSPTVMFVFLSFLNKEIPRQIEIVVDLFRILKDLALKWHLLNGEFKRLNDQQFLVSYVVNTLGIVLGKCMKEIYISDKTKHDLIEYFRVEPNSLFKLFLYKHFIEVVSTIDIEMEFVPYRTMLVSFQEKMVPIFLEELYPYFISVTDTMKINELSSMLPTLSETKVQHHFDLFRSEDKMVSQLVFSLLSEIVNFKYNITFCEYDLDGEFEHIMITFPQSVLKTLISKEFLEAFYFMLEKMVSMNYTGNYFDTSFECLKKILITKITNLDKEQQVNLMQLHNVGLFRMIKANVSSQKAMEKIFECTFKFIHAFDQFEVEEYNLNYIQLSMAIKEKAIMVIKETQLTSDNRLLQTTCQLVSKVASESISPSQKKHKQFYKQLCMDFYFTFFEAYITKDYNILGKMNVLIISSLATILNEYFQQINKIGGMDMGMLFSLIASKSEEVFMSNNCIKIANYLFLITNIFQESFYDRNFNYQSTKEEELKILSKLIQRCFAYFDYYKNTQQRQKIIDIAILLFLEKTLTQCLENQGNTEQENIQITSRTYKVINAHKKLEMSDQSFLTYCFNQMGSSLNTEDYEKVEYVLGVFYQLLTKLKWSLNRGAFMKSKISKDILQTAIELSKNSLQSTRQLLKQRRKLFKIITVLSFDDLLDSYRSNIDFIVESLTYDFKEGNLAKIVFDMSGICENIETSSIYKYFLAQIQEKIGLQLLIKTLYNFFAQDMQMLEEVIHFSSSLISNTSLRMTSRQLSPFIYQMIENSLDFLSMVLEKAKGEYWNEVLNELFNFTNIVLEATYINLFLIKRKCKDKLITFLYNLIDNLIANHQWVHPYHELSKNMYDTFKFFLANCSEVILTWQWDNGPNEQKRFFMGKFVQLIACAEALCNKTLQEAAESGRRYQLSQKFLFAISKLYSFMRYKRNSLHRPHLLESIETVRSESQDSSIKFLSNLYRISMTNIKNISSLLNAICICIMELSYFYPNAYEKIYQSLGIPSEKVEKIKRIYTNIEDFKEDPFFLSNLRQWLYNNENHYDANIDY